MKTLIRHFKKVNGQSLAEFAVTTAMMATLATTAAPKFSGVGEGAKEKKTLADIDKIFKICKQLLQRTSDQSWSWSFLGQWKYNEPVPTGGGYTYDTGPQLQDDAEYQVKDAIQGRLNEEGDVTTQPTFNGFDNSADAPNWASCFGTNNPDARIPEVEGD